ncbi:hypothetical protein D3C87_1085530 [compost metagenome]
MSKLNNVFVNFGVDEDDVVSVSVENLGGCKWLMWYMDGGIEDKNNGNGWGIEDVLVDVKKWMDGEKKNVVDMVGDDEEYVNEFDVKMDNCFKVFEEKLKELVGKGFNIVSCKGWSVEVDNNMGLMLVNYDEVEVVEEVFVNDCDKDVEEE